MGGTGQISAAERARLHVVLTPPGLSKELPGGGLFVRLDAERLEVPEEARDVGCGEDAADRLGPTLVGAEPAIGEGPATAGDPALGKHQSGPDELSTLPQHPGFERVVQEAGA